MIQITKEEKDFIAERLPYIHIRRTMAGKSKRHRYYMEESSRAMDLLNYFHAQNTRITETKQ